MVDLVASAFVEGARDAVVEAGLERQKRLRRKARRANARARGLLGAHLDKHPKSLGGIGGCFRRMRYRPTFVVVRTRSYRGTNPGAGDFRVRRAICGHELQRQGCRGR